MPRIDAPTVAEHHARQRRALLDAARGLLAEDGRVPSMAAVARRAGLARPSVYQYFPSADDLLAAVVADVMPDWAHRVLARVEAETTPTARVWAYVEANVDLLTSPEQAVASALAQAVAPEVLRGPMEAFHASLQVPLRTALADAGEPEPEAMAQLVDALIMNAVRAVPATPSGDPARALVLGRLRRLLGPFLGTAER